MDEDLFWQELYLRDFGIPLGEGDICSWKEEYQNSALLYWDSRYTDVPDEDQPGDYAFIFSEHRRKIVRDQGKGCCPKVSCLHCIRLLPFTY